MNKKITVFLTIISIFSVVVLTAIMRDVKPSYQAKTINGEKYLVILIPSFNNEHWCKENLESVFRQQYNNYHVVYIDDCSTDGTFARVQEISKKIR
jgi:Glycosyltransferases involved in cell wall biogenesis